MWELDSNESWELKNWCFWTVVLEKTLESHLDSKEIKSMNPKKLVLNIHWKDWCWSRNSNTLSTWWEELAHWKRPWCWGRLKAGREGDGRGWDGWMVSPTRWTWDWVSSGSRWLTGKPGMLLSTGSKVVGHDWQTELNWATIRLQLLPMGNPEERKSTIWKTQHAGFQIGEVLWKVSVSPDSYVFPYIE